MDGSTRTVVGEKTYSILDFLEPNRASFSDHATAEWKDVVEAVEDALPVYESVSEAISLGLAGPLRRRAISQLSDHRKDWILDSGAGPGVSSRMLLEQGFGRVVGVDPSMTLLRHAKERLGNDFHPVRGVAENLPFREKSFGGAITCFSLRDARDTLSALHEFARVLENRGRLEIVDVGRPDGQFASSLVSLYVFFGMPLLARILIGGRIWGNPFQMIGPTFRRLATNHRLCELASRVFGRSKLQEFFLGGMIIIEAERRS